MAAPATVQLIRTSFLWTEVGFELFALSAPTAGPLSFLGRDYLYAQAYANGTLDGSGTFALQRPWPQPTGQMFWTYYLEGNRPGDVNGKQAWQWQVPVRGKVPGVVVTPPWSAPGRRLDVEAFFYPFGRAVVLTVTAEGPFTLTQAVATLLAIRRSDRFTIVVDGAPPRAANLDALADALLVTLRTKTVGSSAALGVRSVTPFTVTTVLQGSNVDPARRPPNRREIHRTLHGLASMSATYTTDTLPTLAAASIELRKNTPPGHLLYADTRGRAVWFPTQFTQTGARLSTLACYHRNQLFASLQVESIGGFLRATAGLLRGGVALEPPHETAARLAAGLFGRIYGGVRETYRSASMKQQIDQSDTIDDANLLRSRYNLPAMSAGGP